MLPIQEDKLCVVLKEGQPLAFSSKKRLLYHQLTCCGWSDDEKENIFAKNIGNQTLEVYCVRSNPLAEKWPSTPGETRPFYFPCYTTLNGKLIRFSGIWLYRTTKWRPLSHFRFCGHNFMTLWKCHPCATFKILLDCKVTLFHLIYSKVRTENTQSYIIHTMTC